MIIRRAHTAVWGQTVSYTEDVWREFSAWRLYVVTTGLGVIVLNALRVLGFMRSSSSVPPMQFRGNMPRQWD
jgi:hypothetical protein